MKRLLIFICILFAASVVFAQTQKGYVTTRGRLTASGTTIPGTRLTGATITFKGSSPVISGSNGVFTFAVPSKSFCITNVQKNGYQLYDADLLGRTHKYSANDLLVVMDTPDNVLADKLASEKKIRRTLQKQLMEKEDELEALKEQQKITEEQYRKQLQELYAAQENNEKLISEMAERYSTMDFDQMDEFQRKVAAYIQNGELTRADSLLNTKGSMEERSAELDRENAAIEANAEELKKRQEEQSKSEALYARKLEDFAADCYSRFEICKLRHDNESAAYWLKLRASKDTLNVDWQLEAGGFIDTYLADYGTALRYFHKALDAALAQEGEKGEGVAANYNNIGSVYTSQGEYSKALEMHQNALKIRLEIFGASHPDVATSYNNIGSVYSSQGEYSKALEMYQKALKIWLEIFGASHPDVATSYNNIGRVYSSQGDYAKALEMFRKALKIRLEIFGASHPDVALIYNNIGLVYFSQGEYSKALEMHQNALKIWLEIFGASHPDIATSYNNIGGVYSSQGEYSKALEMYQKALKIWLEIFGASHPTVAQGYNNIGFVYSSQGEYSKALEMYQKALKIWLEIYGASHPYVATSYNNIGSVYSSQGEYSRALEMYQKALKIRLEIFGENHPDVALSYNNIGFVYGSQGEYSRALEMYQKALKIQLEIFGESHPDVATSYNNLCDCYWKAKSKGVELTGFSEFTGPRVFTATTAGSETPALKAGMSGEYYVLEFADWTIDSESSLYEKNEEMRGNPISIVVMKDGIISQYHFENTIGVQLGYKYVGEQEKQRILKAYKEWKEKQ